jgi:hypothetical protein
MRLDQSTQASGPAGQVHRRAGPLSGSTKESDSGPPRAKNCYTGRYRLPITGPSSRNHRFDELKWVIVQASRSKPAKQSWWDWLRLLRAGSPPVDLHAPCPSVLRRQRRHGLGVGLHFILSAAGNKNRKANSEQTEQSHDFLVSRVEKATRDRELSRVCEFYAVAAGSVRNNTVVRCYAVLHAANSLEHVEVRLRRVQRVNQDLAQRPD